MAQAFSKCGFTSGVHFQNWFGTLSTNSPILFPKNEAELSSIVKIVASKGCRIRVRGAGHSESGVVMINGNEDDGDGDVIIVNLKDLTPHPNWDGFLLKENEEDYGPSVRMSAGASTAEMIGIVRPQGYLMTTNTAGAIFSVGGLYLNPSTIGSQSVHTGRCAKQVVGVRVLDGTGTYKEYNVTDPELKDFRGSLGLLGIVTGLEILVRKDTGLLMKRDSVSIGSDYGGYFNKTKVEAFLTLKFSGGADGIEFFYNHYEDIIDTYEIYNTGGPSSFDPLSTISLYEERSKEYSDLAYSGGNRTMFSTMLGIFSEFNSRSMSMSAGVAQISRLESLGQFDTASQTFRDGFWLNPADVPRSAVLYMSVHCEPSSDGSPICLNEIITLLEMTREISMEIINGDDSKWYPDLPAHWCLFQVGANEMTLEHHKPGTHVGFEYQALKRERDTAYNNYLKQIEDRWRNSFPEGSIHHGKQFGYGATKKKKYEGNNDVAFSPYQNDDILDAVYTENVKLTFLEKMTKYDPKGVFRAGNALRMLGISELKDAPPGSDVLGSVKSLSSVGMGNEWWLRFELAALILSLLLFVGTFTWFRRERSKLSNSSLSDFGIHQDRKRTGISTLQQSRSLSRRTLGEEIARSTSFRGVTTILEIEQNEGLNTAETPTKRDGHARVTLTNRPSMIRFSDDVPETGRKSSNRQQTLVAEKEAARVTSFRGLVTMEELSAPETQSGQGLVFPTLVFQDFDFVWTDGGNENHMIIQESNSFWLGGCKLTAIQGPSGSGKSTLLRILAGHKATHMKVSVGKCIARPRMVMCQQHSDLWPEEMKVCDVLLFACRLFGADITKSKHIWNFLGLPRLFDLPFGAISGGQKQLVNIATCLLHPEPSLIFLDEPMAALDSERAYDLLRMIKSLPTEHSFVITAHMCEDRIQKEFDRLIILAGLTSNVPGYHSSGYKSQSTFDENIVHMRKFDGQSDNAEIMLAKKGTITDGLSAMITLWHGQFSGWPKLELVIFLASLASGPLVGCLGKGVINGHGEDFIPYQYAIRLHICFAAIYMGMKMVSSLGVSAVYGPNEHKILLNFVSQRSLNPFAYVINVILRCTFFGLIQVTGWYVFLLPIIDFAGKHTVAMAVNSIFFCIAWGSFSFLLITAVPRVYSIHSIVIANSICLLLAGALFPWETVPKFMKGMHYIHPMFYVLVNTSRLALDQLTTGCPTGWRLGTPMDDNDFDRNFPKYFMDKVCAPSEFVYDELGFPVITTLHLQLFCMFFTIASCAGIWLYLEYSVGTITKKENDSTAVLGAYSDPEGETHSC